MEMSFEEAKNKIDQIIKNMEMGTMTLEESISQFEEAVKLVDYCQNILDSYKGKIEAISTKGESSNEWKIFRYFKCKGRGSK